VTTTELPSTTDLGDTEVDASRDDVLAAAARAREASFALATTSRKQKDAALVAMADALIARADEVLAANAVDVQIAVANGTAAGLVDRLTLNTERLTDIAEALRDVADLPDPVGEVVRGYTLPNGLEIRQVRVPFGVVGIVYEARPNVTVDAAGLCLKSGNAALLRGSGSAYRTNVALINVLGDALEASGLPRDAVTLVPGTSRESVQYLLTARGLVDVIIPRGGGGLIKTVVENSTVPVIETGVGNVHVYLDESAPLQRSIDIVINSKTQRTSVCNTAETLLVNEQAADRLLPGVLAALKDKGVTIHGDERFRPYAEAAGIAFAPANDVDWADEYYSLDIAAGIVDSLDDALGHIRKWSTGHTEAIVTDSQDAARRFVAGVDSAVVMVNASTRFTDGGEFGFGAEIGISTQKLHARGPMGLPELTSTKYVVVGEGHVRP
jgi:glutamate-5-semialdehyde dehydrogenase